MERPNTCLLKAASVCSVTAMCCYFLLFYCSIKSSQCRNNVGLIAQQKSTVGAILPNCKVPIKRRYTSSCVSREHKLRRQRLQPSSVKKNTTAETTRRWATVSISRPSKGCHLENVYFCTIKRPLQ